MTGNGASLTKRMRSNSQKTSKLTSKTSKLNYRILIQGDLPSDNCLEPLKLKKTQVGIRFLKKIPTALKNLCRKGIKIANQVKVKLSRSNEKVLQLTVISKPPFLKVLETLRLIHTRIQYTAWDSTIITSFSHLLSVVLQAKHLAKWNHKDKVVDQENNLLKGNRGELGSNESSLIDNSCQ